MIKKFTLILIVFASNIVWANTVFLEETTNGDNYIILKFENDSDQTSVKAILDFGLLDVDKTDLEIIDQTITFVGSTRFNTV